MAQCWAIPAGRPAAASWKGAWARGGGADTEVAEEMEWCGDRAAAATVTKGGGGKRLAARAVTANWILARLGHLVVPPKWSTQEWTTLAERAMGKA